MCYSDDVTTLTCSDDFAIFFISLLVFLPPSISLWFRTLLISINFLSVAFMKPSSCPNSSVSVSISVWEFVIEPFSELFSNLDLIYQIFLAFLYSTYLILSLRVLNSLCKYLMRSFRLQTIGDLDMFRVGLSGDTLFSLVGIQLLAYIPKAPNSRVLDMGIWEQVGLLGWGR